MKRISGLGLHYQCMFKVGRNWALRLLLTMKHKEMFDGD
jgi:hypothetical protein